MTSDKTEKWKKERELISKEIVDTEISYVASLQAIVEVFIEPMNREKKPVLNKEEADCVFGGIAVLYQLHTKFLADLQKRVKNSELCGQDFLAFTPYFKMYTSYINNHAKASAILEKHLGKKSKKKKFRKFVEPRTQDPRCKGNNLVSLLIMPIQRIPRYKLLLEQLFKRTEDTDPGRGDLEKAIEKVNEVAIHINESVRTRETSEEVVQLQTQFEDKNGEVKFIAAGRILYKRGYAKVVPPADPTKASQNLSSHIICFNDLFVEAFPTKKAKDESKLKYKLARQIPISKGTMVFDLTDGDATPASPQSPEPTSPDSKDEPTSPSSPTGGLPQSSSFSNSPTIYIQGSMSLLPSTTSTRVLNTNNFGIHITFPPVTSSGIEGVESPREMSKQESKLGRASNSELWLFFATAQDQREWLITFFRCLEPWARSSYFNAALNDNLPLVKYFLESASAHALLSVDTPDEESGWTALHHAVTNKNLPLVEYLLSLKPFINFQAKDGQTILMMAARTESREIIDKVMRAGADYTLTDKVGNTVFDYCGPEQTLYLCLREERDGILLWAVKQGKLNIATKMVVDYRAEINYPDVDGWTPLIHAAANNHSVLVKFLIENKSNINYLTKAGDTALIIASRKEHSNIIDILLQNKADLTIKNQNKKTALDEGKEIVKCLEKESKYYFSTIIQMGYTPVIHSFITDGVPLNDFDKDDLTPLMTAIKFSHSGIVKMLLDGKANVNLANQEGNTSLHLAVRLENVILIESLLSAGADVFITNKKGETSLDSSNSKILFKIIDHEQYRDGVLVGAAHKGRVDIIKQLLLAKANINYQTNDGDTPLIAAAKHNEDKAIVLLMENGADLSLVNKAGESVFDQKNETIYTYISSSTNTKVKGAGLIAAAKLSHLKLLKYLLEKKVDIINFEDEFRHSPLLYAAERHKPEIVSTILSAKANLRAKNKNGQTALHLHIASLCQLKEGPNEVSSLLLRKDNSCPINGQDEKGYTALMIAAEKHSEQLVTFLVNSGADPTLKNKEKKTALDLVGKDNEEVTKILKNSLLKIETTLKKMEEENKKQLEKSFSSPSFSESKSSLNTSQTVIINRKESEGLQDIDSIISKQQSESKIATTPTSSFVRSNSASPQGSKKNIFSRTPSKKEKEKENSTNTKEKGKCIIL